MPVKRTVFSLASAILFFVVIAPGSANAITRVAVTSGAQCPPVTVTTICYVGLTDAINAALAGDSIQIMPGTYTGPFTISTNIASIYGNETATTFISGGGGPALTLSNITGNITIRRLTFVTASTGILAQNSPSLTITNNIFEVGPSGTSIQLSASPNALIYNNTFYQNENGIISDSNLVNVTNNIFSSVQNAMTAGITLTSILNNLFFNVSVIGPAIDFNPADLTTYLENLENQNPSFASVGSANLTLNDFHLTAGSPCIGTGNTSVGNNSVNFTTPDMGAYGGPNADTIPFIVSGVSAVTSGASIDVSWAQNFDYIVTGYNVYYGSASGVYNGTGADQGPSPVAVPGAAMTSLSLTGLATAVTPSVPTLLSTAPVNEGLVLTWTAAAGATGYNVYYGVGKTSTPTTSISVGNVTTYTLGGLTNGQYYNIGITATSQSLYYIAVTAIDGATPSSPGVSNESDYSKEVTGGSGGIMESALSNTLADYPEALVAYPNLPNTTQGCFIATAAYGYYSAPQVQALRNFRDRFLVTNRLGNAFVEWYYTYSPAAADWLNEHPQYKPFIRAALLPVVGLALFMTQTSSALRCGLLIFTTCIIFYAFYRRRLSRLGGSR